MNTPTVTDTPPLFSVVIATYNYGHLIERAVDSVLEQSFRDFELIVVDDGSTDDTLTRMQRYAGVIRYVRQQNSGQSRAYNLGADLAAGRFVYILDADDELLPDTLAHFAHAINERGTDSPLCLYFGGYISVAESGEERVRMGTDAPEDTAQRFERFLRKRIVGLKNGAVVLPRSIFQRIRYPENLRSNTDIVFLGQAVALLSAVQIHQLVLRSYEHPLRSRNQRDTVISFGTAPVEALFDPLVIPRELMPLKCVFLAQKLRSMARLFYLNGDFTNARRAYLHALRTHPPVMADVSSLRRLILAVLRSLRRSEIHS